MKRVRVLISRPKGLPSEQDFTLSKTERKEILATPRQKKKTQARSNKPERKLRRLTIAQLLDREQTEDVVKELNARKRRMGETRFNEWCQSISKGDND